MNILFLSLSSVTDINSRGIYTDLLREFIKNDNEVFIVTSVERRYNQRTELIKQGKATILKVKTLNIQKTNIIEKGLGTICLEYQFLSAVRRYYDDIRFDLVLYATPPITLIRPIKYIKKKCNARTYLMLKDIFPQNAVDLGLIKTTGVERFLHYYFRKKEKKLYSISDRIGCMSQANINYILEHNRELESSKIEICPNAMDFQNIRLAPNEIVSMREKYGLPVDKKIFVYGGNLGKPQGIPFIIKCLRAEKNNEKVFFLIVGEGTEFNKLELFIENENPINVKLMNRISKDDYDRMIAACDVGLVFLDYRFTIPNFPSRLLSYIQADIPVLACTDKNSDVINTIENYNFGIGCHSNDVNSFSASVEKILNMNFDNISRESIRNEFSSRNVARKIIDE